MSTTSAARSPAWRGLAIAAALVSLADVVQPLILAWRPKLWGALAGAILYAAIAAGAWHRRRWAAGLALAVPVLPVSILLATVGGLTLPVAPDAAMVGILVIQLAAAACGAVALRR